MHILIYLLFLLLVLYIVAIWPGRSRKERMELYARQPIAHRGFHDNSGPAPENSMAAFRKAVEMGYGIELDIRETSDGLMVVSHDDSLKRPAGIDRNISDMKWSELKDICLFQSNEHIPLFKDVLEMVHGRVPLVVEIKSETRNVGPICENAVFWLDSYEGNYCIESFNPFVVLWFRKNRPQVLRGQLSEKFRRGQLPTKVASYIFSACMFNFLARPDFIAYNVLHKDLLRYRIQHDVFHTFGIAWTIKSNEMMREAAKYFEAFIFDSFTPEQTYSEHVEVPQRSEDDMKNIVRVYMLLSGSVTGVGFRYRATWIAQSLGITGWVRNTSDDMQVEMELQGPRSAIDEMIDRLGNERFITITSVEEEPRDLLTDEYEFKVKY